MPGFRIGRAPRKLVENKFRKEIGEQIKGSLLLDSLSQISDEQKFTAISEPDLNLDSIEVPEDGPMTFEFDIEVRPEFEMPKWKGMKLERLVRDFTPAEVEQHLEKMLTRLNIGLPLRQSSRTWRQIMDRPPARRTSQKRGANRGRRVPAALFAVKRCAA